MTQELALETLPFEFEQEIEGEDETLLAEIFSEFTTEAEVGGAAYTVCDFIDQRIDVPAQYALHAMTMADAASRNAALGILAAVKAGRLEGFTEKIGERLRSVPSVLALATGL